MRTIEPEVQACSQPPEKEASRQVPAENAREQPRPPLLLARALELFEPACATAGTVARCLPDPDTATLIAVGQSLDGIVRRLRPDEHLAMRKTKYILEGQHQPTATTLEVIAQTFAPVMPHETTTRLLRGELAESDLPRFLPWREFQRATGPLPADSANTPFGEMVAYLVGREAFYARLFHHERAGRSSPERDNMEKRRLEGLQSWRSLNPGLMLTVFPLVEELLHGIAWLEERQHPSGNHESIVLALLETKRRPMGHWLHAVARASGARSLDGLQQVLFRLGVRYKGENKEDPFIKTDTLKKWSASRQMLMPPEALSPVLGGVPEGQRLLLEGRYFLARVLSFLMALVRAGTQGEAPSWVEAQDQLKRRYTEVYLLQVRLASEQTA